MFCPILRSELIRLLAQDWLGVVQLLLRLDGLLELLLSFNSNALQLEPVRVEELEAFLDLRQLFVAQVENTSGSVLLRSPEANLSLRLRHWGLRSTEEALPIIDSQDGHDDSFQIGR